MYKRILVITISITLLFSVGCGTSNQATSEQLLNNPSTKTEFLMGTVVTLKIYNRNKDDVLNIVFDHIKELADKISPEKSDSEISLINDQAGKSPVKVSAAVYQLIDDGMQYSHLSEGLFDISVGPLTSLWHIGFPDARKPNQSEIDSILPLIDYEEIVLNEIEQTVFLTDQGMSLDLGAIAKGFITDEIITILKDHDVTSAIIDLGGNIYVMGNNPSRQQWSVGIQDPDASRGTTVGKITTSNHSIVTSGIYERFLEIDGEKYHHLLDPRHGYPFMNDVAGITIIAESSTAADALSTIGFAKGISEGIKFIEETANTEAIFISHDHKVYTTEGIKDIFVLTNEQFKMGDQILGGD